MSRPIYNRAKAFQNILQEPAAHQKVLRFVYTNNPTIDSRLILSEQKDNKPLALIVIILKLTKSPTLTSLLYDSGAKGGTQPAVGCHSLGVNK